MNDPSNHPRSRATKWQSIFFYLLLFVVFQVSMGLVVQKHGSVLSYASNINVGDLLSDTNQKRQANGLSSLRLNDQLTQVAKLKGDNMFAEQYWAHTSPSGKDPWYFFAQVGYHYLYAGENLARDFSDSAGVVDAWMNSPSHRENLLNSHYQEVGFAVVNGKYGSNETTLVVQEFGTLAGGIPTVSAPPTVTPQVKAEANQNPPITANAPAPQPKPVELVPTVISTPIPSPKPSLFLSSFEVTKGVSLVLIGFLCLMFLWDTYTAHRRQLERVASHNVAHFCLIAGLILVLLILKPGLIL